MTKSERLLALLDLLRRYRYPVTGAVLANELQVSLRTLYRDIASLQAQGATIEGEAGLGYVLRPGFHVPPLMFSHDELEALVLGSRLVASLGEGALLQDARSAMAKIAACLPKALADSMQAVALHVPPDTRFNQPETMEVVTLLRKVIRDHKKLAITYCDAHGKFSKRIIWAFGLAFFAKSRIILAHCEERDDFRHFRTDRILSCNALPQSYPQSRSKLLRDWAEMMKESCEDFKLEQF
ncbi:helix-turn-helix transcriptional regulator [Bartonella sp. HY406]|uniref:helix-turn-helix transcriptional regulator n=1 Tax=Bartonella sp. HY406 TaxID=2979331 RepID=UPI0021C7A270|nr:YafY family protein [Bartonella sp. HY406]UXN02423.1 YafY family transcriptional regulator [Bartonella sp. HY406]